MNVDAMNTLKILRFPSPKTAKQALPFEYKITATNPQLVPCEDGGPEL